MTTQKLKGSPEDFTDDTKTPENDPRNETKKSDESEEVFFSWQHQSHEKF